MRAIPGQGTEVPITLLGSSVYSAQLAAYLGLPFAFAAHFAPDYLYEASRMYRTQFRPRVLKKPHLIAAVPVVAAETDERAQWLFTSPQQRFLRLVRNQPVELVPPVNSLDEMERPWSALEREAVKSKLAAAIVGSNATVKAGIEELLARTGADEVIVVTDLFAHADRLESYERVAEVARELGEARVA